MMALPFARGTRAAPTLPRNLYRKSGATTAQPYAVRIARKSQPTLFIDHDLAPLTTVSGE